MRVEMSTVTGIVAGVFTAISLIPQLVKIIKEKKADNISYGMLAVLMVGLILWVCYGIMKNDYPIIITNSFSLLINILILGFTIRYKSKN